MDHLPPTSDVAMQNHDISPVTFHRFVIDNAPCAVVTVDSDFKISTLNPWAEKLTGYSSAEATRRYCGDILRCGMCKHMCRFRLRHSC